MFVASQGEEHGLGVTVADARFMKPLDTDLIRDLVASHDVLITVSFASEPLHFIFET